MLSLARQTFTKRREDILVDSAEVVSMSLLNQFKELHKSYVVKSFLNHLRDCFSCTPIIAIDLSNQMLYELYYRAVLPFQDMMARNKRLPCIYLLFHLLAKKGSEETIIYTYEKCKVSLMSM